MNRALLLISLSVTGCSSLVCGPGTMRVGDACLAVLADGGPGSDAGDVDAGTDGGPPRTCPVVARPASDPGSVACETVTCSGTDTCFIDSSTGMGSCLPPGSMRLGWAGALLRHCDESADCGTGTVCCETFVYSGSWHGTTTTCESSCSYGAPAQACRTDAECATTMQCRAYELDPTLTVSTCHAPIGCP